MSRKRALIIGLALVAFGIYWRQAGLRWPLTDNYQSRKPPLARLSAAEKTHITRKITGPLNVDVHLDGNAPEKVGDVFSLKAIVTAREPLSNVQVIWGVLKGAEVDAGDTMVVLPEVVPGTPQVVSLSLRAIDPDNEFVNVRARAGSSGVLFSAVGFYRTGNLANDAKELLKKHPFPVSNSGRGNATAGQGASGSAKHLGAPDGKAPLHNSSESEKNVRIFH